MSPESKPQDRSIFPDPMMDGCAEGLAQGCTEGCSQVALEGCAEAAGGCIGGLAALPLALLSAFWSS